MTGDGIEDRGDTAPRRPVTLITGCSRGIGLAIAEDLATKHNHTVIATMRDVSSAPESLRASGCHVHALDVTSDESISAMSAYLSETHGGVDIVVNNAGYGVPGSCESIPLPQQQALFDTNVWGVVRLAQALLPVLRARGGGVFLAVSSTSGVRTVPGMDAYGASKRAVEGLLEGLRYSVARDGIRIAVVNPGPIDTGFLARFRAEGAEAEKDADRGASGRRPGGGSERSIWSDWLGQRMGCSTQPVEGCADAIARVTQREWDAVCRGDTSLARFWNGTDEASQAVVESVKVAPDGVSGPYAEMFAEAQQRLGGASKAAVANAAKKE